MPGIEGQSRTRVRQLDCTLWGPKVLETENPDHGEFERHRAAIDRIVARIEGSFATRS